MKRNAADKRCQETEKVDKICINLCGGTSGDDECVDQTMDSKLEISLSSG